MSEILIISPGHSPDRSSRQPWAYIQRIGDELTERGHEVVIVGDGPAPNKKNTSHPWFEQISNVRDVGEIKTVAQTFEPDVCLWSVGPTSSLYLSRRLPNIADQMMAVIPGPIYSPRQFFTQLSSRDLTDLPSHASLAVGSVIPLRWFAFFLRQNFDIAIAPTTTIVEQICSRGFPREKALHVPHGINCGILTTTSEANEFRDGIPTPPEQDYVVNFGPPRPIRGAQDFIEGVLAARESGHDVKGVILSRIDNEDDRKLLREIENNLVDRGEQEAFIITEEYLTPHELKSFIRGSRLVVLPYRIVQSTVPISIIEALGLGRPVVTTNINGARELVPSSDYTVSTKSAKEIGNSINHFLNGRENQSAGCLSTGDLNGQLPTWETSIQPLVHEIDNSRQEGI